jgi:hypothetical protein
MVKRYSRIGSPPPSAAAAALSLHNVLERRLRTTNRTASAVITPAIGAKNIVKKPKDDANWLPMYERTLANKNAKG